jgi:hypothetical protein
MFFGVDSLKMIVFYSTRNISFMSNFYALPFAKHAIFLPNSRLSSVFISQKFQVSSGGQDESRSMRDQREEVGRQLRSQQEQLAQLEQKLAQLLREGQEESDDSGTITLSDEETVGPSLGSFPVYSVGQVSVSKYY